MALITLWDAPAKTTALVAELDSRLSQLVVNRLHEMGLEQGQSVLCMGRGPFNGPLIVQIQDCVYTLEQKIAQQVFIHQHE